MALYGKTIRIYLADGNPTGIRHAELVNWTGQAIVCPRVRTAQLASWEEAARPGVYFLVGDDDSESRPLVYIGEAESVWSRLQAHVKQKEFWNRVVLFTSKDDNLTKAHVKYLEARLIEMAQAAGRARIENGNAPQSPALPRADRDAMEEFLEPLQVLLGALGFPWLQGIAPRPQANAGGPGSRPDPVLARPLRFAVAKAGIDATGAVTDEGFVVYKNSIGRAQVKAHLGKGYKAYRDELIAEGRIAERGAAIVFTADVLFTSPSAAAAVLAGGAYNGREAWRDESGTSLKVLEETLAGDPVVKAPAPVLVE